jgi:hypothetical protein
MLKREILVAKPDLVCQRLPTRSDHFLGSLLDFTPSGKLACSEYFDEKRPIRSCGPALNSERAVAHSEVDPTTGDPRRHREAQP